MDSLTAYLEDLKRNPDAVPTLDLQRDILDLDITNYDWKVVEWTKEVVCERARNKIFETEADAIANVYLLGKGGSVGVKAFIILGCMTSIPDMDQAVWMTDRILG